MKSEILTLTHSANGTYYVAPVPLGQAPVQVIAIANDLNMI